MPSQYLWNVANRGQARLTCMQVRPLLIIPVPLLENIMYGETEGSARPNAHCVLRVWRPLLESPWHSWNPRPAGSPRCQAVLCPWAEEGTRQPTAPGVLSSHLDSAKPDCHFTERSLQEHFGSTQAGVCLKEPVDIKGVEASALHRRQQQASPQAGGLSSKFTGVLHAEYSQIPFSLQETYKGWQTKPKES